MKKELLIKVAAGIGLGGLLLWLLSKRGQQKSLPQNQQQGEDQVAENECGGPFEDQANLDLFAAGTDAMFVRIRNYTAITAKTTDPGADAIENWTYGASVEVRNACNGEVMFSANLDDTLNGYMDGTYSGQMSGASIVELNGQSYAYQTWWITVPSTEVPPGKYVIKWKAGPNGVPQNNSAGIQNTGYYEGASRPIHYAGILQPDELRVATNAIF